MAFDGFVKIEELPGGSTDSQHSGWIEIEGYEHVLSHRKLGGFDDKGRPTSGGAEHGDFTIRKRVDQSSPLLSRHCCQGSVFAQVVVEICKAAGEKTPYMRVELSDAKPIRVVVVGNDEQDGHPREEVAFVYGRIDWRYTGIDGQGKPIPPVPAFWDRRTAKGG